eukprot:1639254-Prymnesium_polylepis.1
MTGCHVVLLPSSLLSGGPQLSRVVLIGYSRPDASSHPLKMRTCTCSSRGQSSEAIISVTQIAFFVNGPGKGGSVAAIKPQTGMIGFSDEESADLE